METWTGTDQEAEEIFWAIYEKEYEKLVRYAAACLKVDSKPYAFSRAEDVVQETFALGWKRRKDVLSREEPVGWLYKAIYYKAREHMKEEYRWTKLLLQYKELYAPAAEDNAYWELELKSLVSEEDFKLLHRLYMEGYSYREICRETGVTKSALGVRLHRIKHKIQEQLKK